MEILVVIAAIGAGLAKVVDWFRNAFDPKTRAPAWIWNALALALGLGTAFAFDLNLFAMLEGRTQVAGAAGRILTGVSLAGLAGGAHEVFDLFSSIAKGRHRR